MTAQSPAGATRTPPEGVGLAEDDRVRRVELLISRLLRTGVLLSLLVVVAGMVITFARNPDYFSSHAQLHPLISTGAQFPHTPTSVIRGLRHGSGPAVVMVGLLLLIATPVMRGGQLDVPRPS